MSEVLTRSEAGGVFLTRRAPAGLALRPETANETSRTVEAVLTTGAAVRRQGFMERLALGAPHVDLPQHVPLLDAHRTGSVQDVLGVAADFRREDGAIVAILRVHDEALWTKIMARAITGISIGYVVAEWKDSTENGVRVRTAVKWAIHEVSAVPIPADAAAVIRSTPQEDSMEPNTPTQPVIPAAVAPQPMPQPGAEIATRAEINTRIRSEGQAANLPAEFINAQVDGGVTVEAFRSAAFEHLTRSVQPIRVQVGASHDDPAAIHERRVEGLAHRMAPDLCQVSDGARPYAGMSLASMAREALAREGVRGLAAMSDETVLTRAQHTVSDFPALLDGAGQRILLASYTAAASPVRTILARQRLARDFRAISLLRLDGPSALQRVTESGEIKAVTAAEAKEGFALETFAGLFNLSRKALINDDLGAFADWQRQMGRAAAETEAATIVALLTANAGMGAKLSDGKALFHADHGNITAADDLSVAALTAARTAMRRQKNPNGSPANVTPRFLLVAPEEETAAEQVVAALTASTAEAVNPFGGKLTVLVEPRLPAGAWMLFADPAVSPVIEYAYLSSAPGPQLASRDGWDVLGRSFRVVLDFGCGVTDYRGTQRNPGETL